MLYTMICIIGILANGIVIYVIITISSLTPAKVLRLSLLSRKTEQQKEKENVDLQITLSEENEKKIEKYKDYKVKDDRNFFQRIYKKFACLKLSITNYYLLNLAFADFTLLFFVIFLIVTSILKRWIFGFIWCKIYFSVVYICQLNASFIISILSFDRWLAVIFPLKVKNYRNLFITRIIIFVSWSLAIILAIPVMMFATETEESMNSTYQTNQTLKSFRCVIDIDNTIGKHILLPGNISPLKAFQLYWLTIIFIIPVTFVIIFYIQVVRRLKLNSKNSRIVQSINRLKTYKKITYMCLAIIACYVICWTPYWCVQFMLTVISHEEYHNSIMYLSNITQLIAYLNSALNPILYSFLSEDFQSNFKFTCFFLDIKS